MHEVSTDGVSWLAASSYAELFGDGEAAPTIETRTAERVTASSTSRSPNASPQRVAGEWYYSDGGGSEGPFGLAEIQRLASQGVISPADHVWDPGKSAWVEAASISSLGFGSREPRQSPSAAYQSTDNGAGMSQAAWALKSTAGWKLFIALWCLVMGVLVVVGALIVLSRAGGVEPLIASAIGSLASGIYFVLLGAFLLTAYAAVTAAASNPKDEVIAAAIRAENRVWVAVAIALLLATLGSILFAIVFNNPSL
jgi:hypothetical protein